MVAEQAVGRLRACKNGGMAILAGDSLALDVKLVGKFQAGRQIGRIPIRVHHSLAGKSCGEHHHDNDGGDEKRFPTHAIPLPRRGTENAG